MTTGPLVDVYNVEALSPDEAKAAFLSLVKMQRSWTEITDDPETWPPENVVVLVWDLIEIRIAIYDKDKWSAPLGPYLMRNQKIGWIRRRRLKNQRVYMWRPI